MGSVGLVPCQKCGLKVEGTDETLLAVDSASGGRPAMWAHPECLPRWPAVPEPAPTPAARPRRRR